MKALRVCISIGTIALALGLGMTFEAAAATYHVRPGARGDGSDWSNALGALPSSLERGATYYLAAGNYARRSFNDAESGSELITIKKATQDSHGSDAGWQGSYAGQAVFAADWVFHKGHYLIDGQARDDGDWQDIAAYGINISVGRASQENDMICGIMIPERVTNITLRNIAISGPGCGYGQVAGRGINIAGGGAVDIKLKKCLIRNTAVPILTRGVQGMVVEHCWIGPNFAIYDGYHCEGWSDSNSNNVIIRNNRFVDIMNTAFIALISTSGGAPHYNWHIYGNVFMHHPRSVWDGMGVGDGIIAVINKNTAINWRVYNNTIVNTRGWFASINLPGTGSTVVNNMWYHLGTNPQGGPTGIGIAAEHKGGSWICLANGAAINPSARGVGDVIGTNDPFIDWGSGDVHLNADALGSLPIDNGTPGPADWDRIDPAGRERGADGKWDIGAFEYVASAVKPSPPVNLRATTVSQSRVELAWEEPGGSPVAISRYKVYRDGVEIGTTMGRSYLDRQLQPLTLYTYEVRSVSVDSVLSNQVGGIGVTTAAPDTRPPGAPRNLRTSWLTQNDVDLAWDEAVDDQLVAGYVVYRDGWRVGPTEVLSFSDRELKPATEIIYEISAFDDAGNESERARLEVRTPETPPIATGIVAHYTFDAAADTTLRDSSSYANHGRILCRSGPVWRAGKYDTGLEFNGDGDLVEIPSATSLNLDRGMTLMAWIYPTQTPTGWQHIIAKERDGETLAYYLAANSGDSNQPWAGFSIDNNWMSAGGGGSLEPNRWTHLASTYDSRDLRIYVNGGEVAKFYVGRPIETTTGCLHLGGNNLYEYFAGVLDEVFIYNRALAPSEIRYIYHSVGGEIASVANWTAYR